MLALLVQAAVFKTVGPHGNHVVGGFDSHAFPPFVRHGKMVRSSIAPRRKTETVSGKDVGSVVTSR